MVRLSNQKKYYGVMHERKTRHEKLREIIENETNPEIKQRLIEIQKEHWKIMGLLLEDREITQEELDLVEREKAYVDRILWEKETIARGIPVKHVLRSEYPIPEYREEIDASQVGISYEDDFNAYNQKLDLLIDQALIKLGIEKLVDDQYEQDGHYEQDQVKPECHFRYSEILQKVPEYRAFGSKLWMHLDNIAQDGKTIDSYMLNLDDFFNRNPEYRQKSNMLESANGYISASINRFVKESCWQFAFRNEDDFIDELDDPNNWPILTEDGTWVTYTEEILFPLLWFGLKDTMPDKMWVLDGSDMEFWFNGGKDSYFIKYDNGSPAGCYKGYLPDMKAIREKCPVTISEDDTRESIKEKIQKLLVKKYQILDEGPAKYILHCDYPGLEFKSEIDASQIGCSYKDEYDSYSDELQDDVFNELGAQGVERLLGVHYTEDDVAPKECFDYWIILDKMRNNPPHNENVHVYLDGLNKDGEVIDTKEINIMDVFEWDKEFYQEFGMIDITDDFIAASLKKFVKVSEWQFALEKGHQIITDVKQWPSPNEDGLWIDKDGIEMNPCVWFGINDADYYTATGIWNIENIDFWFSENPESFIMSYNYEEGCNVCYGGSFLPDVKAIRESCPIPINADDTDETIKEKVQAYFIENYSKRINK